MMTPETVRLVIAHAKHKAQSDPEAWHVLVDDLHRDVLKAVASGHQQSVELAAAVLEADAIPAAWSACA